MKDCLNNLQAIGQTLFVYSVENEDTFPNHMPAEARRERRAQAREVQRCPAVKSGENDGYIYVPGHTARSDPNDVLVYESLGRHRRPGGSVLFVDGHVEFLSPPEHKAAIARTKTHLAKTASQPATRSGD